MSSSNFIAPPDGYGIKVLAGGYISMNLLIGNGSANRTQNPPIPLSETFIYIKRHNVVSIQNSVGEGYRLGIDLDGQIHKNSPIHLINNNMNVWIKNSSVVSTGNFYGNAHGVQELKVEGDSDVVSIGDRFCYPGSTYCAGSNWKLIIPNPDGPKPTLQVLAHREAGGNTPMMKIQHPSADKVLLELGNYGTDGTPFYYSIKRDASGWLSFEGNQGTNYTGYKFNGPVTVPSYTFANLPTNTTLNGSLVFCSNCVENSNPCQSGGSGAMAAFYNNLWHCK